MPKGNPSPQLPIEPSATAASPTADERPPLPPGWVWTTLGKVAEINPRDPMLHDLPSDMEVSFVPMAAVDAKRGVIERPQIRPIAEVRKGYTPFQEGDVLFAKITPSMENGKAAIARQLHNGLGFGSTEFHVLRPRGGIVLPEWLFYFVRQERFRQDAKANFTGTAGQLRVPAKFLISYPLPLAPLPEQRRIVAKIEELFSQLDAAEEGLRRVQRNLKRYRAAVLKAAVEGRLVPTEAELARREGRPYETGAELLQRILAERRRKWEEQEWAKRVEKAKKKAAQARRKARGLPTRLKDIPPEEWETIPEEEYRRYLPKDDRWKQKYREPTPPDTASLPPLPEGWVWATVEMVAASIQYGYTQKAHPEPIGPKYLRITDIQDGEVNWKKVPYCVASSLEINKFALKKGDIVFARTGATTGKSYLVRHLPETTLFASYLIRLRSLWGIIPEFLYAYFNTPFYWAQISQMQKGMAQPGVNASLLARLPVPLPPLAEQRRIVAEVERRLSVAREAEKAVEANLKRIARLRQAILKRAFEGKLVPQNPNEESAEKLLARIQAEYHEQTTKEQAQRRSVGNVKQTKARLSIYEVLQKHKAPMSPETLFLEAGFNEKTIDEFYEELRREVDAGRIRERRLQGQVYLEVVQ